METITDRDRRFMQMAIDASIENVNNGGGPFGAVVVRNGEVVSVGASHVPCVSARYTGAASAVYIMVIQRQMHVILILMTSLSMTR